MSMLRTDCYVKQMKSIQFSTLHQLYIRAQGNSNAIANIHLLIRTFKYQCCRFRVHLKLILEYNLKTKINFWSKCPHYIMGCIVNLVAIFFLFSLVLNLTYMGYSLCHIWSVYMQYLRCCDHSNKCLFLVIQQAEVLVNFFGECTIFSQWPLIFMEK